MIYKMWRKEFKLTLNYDKPEHFTRCHWQRAERVLPLWIVYRIVFAVYFLASFVYSVTPNSAEYISDDFLMKYPIFLTHWMYVAEILYFEFASYIVVVRAFKERKKSAVFSEKMPWYYKITWVLYSIALPGSIIVSVVFWRTIYDPLLYPVTPSTVFEHAFNSIFMFIDFLIVAHPLKPAHFIWPLGFAISYSLFSLIYQTSGGTGIKGIIPIYRILDWRYPVAATLTCLFSTLFLMFVYFSLLILQIIKDSIKKVVQTKTEQENKEGRPEGSSARSKV